MSDVEVLIEQAVESVGAAEGVEVIVEKEIAVEVLAEQVVEVITETTADVMVEVGETEVLVEVQTASEIVEVALQGPPGPPGNPEHSPVLTYTSGVLTRIDYASGAYKLFIWEAGKLVQQDYVVGSKTTRKTFSYNPDGTLASVTQTTI